MQVLGAGGDSTLGSQTCDASTIPTGLLPQLYFILLKTYLIYFYYVYACMTECSNVHVIM